MTRLPTRWIRLDVSDMELAVPDEHQSGARNETAAVRFGRRILLCVTV